MTPQWTDKSEYNREEELPEWPSNPNWELGEGEQDFSEQPPPPTSRALTEWEKNERADNEMFYSRMPQRRRHYRFGGQTHQYDGVRVEPKPLQPHAWQPYHWERPQIGCDRVYTARHVREPQYGKYKVGDSFGTFWT